MRMQVLFVFMQAQVHRWSSESLCNCIFEQIFAAYPSIQVLSGNIRTCIQIYD